MDEMLAREVQSIQGQEDGYTKAVKFVASALEHAQGELEKARDTLLKVEDKLAKMRAYAELVVADTEEALLNARTDVDTFEQRVADTRALHAELVGE